MADCDFEITYSKTPDQVKKIITEEITSTDGNIQINDNRGSFTIAVPGGQVTGDVVFGENTLSVTITDKPDLIPCTIIKSVIQEYL